MKGRLSWLPSPGDREHEEGLSVIASFSCPCVFLQGLRGDLHLNCSSRRLDSVVESGFIRADLQIARYCEERSDTAISSRSLVE